MESVGFAESLSSISLVQHLHSRLVKLNEKAAKLEQLKQAHQDAVALSRVFHDRLDLPFELTGTHKAFEAAVALFERLQQVENMVALQKLLGTPRGINATISKYEQAAKDNILLRGDNLPVMRDELLRTHLCIMNGDMFKDDPISLSAKIKEEDRLLDRQIQEWASNLENQSAKMSALMENERAKPRHQFFDAYKNILSLISASKGSLRKDFFFSVGSPQFSSIRCVIETYLSISSDLNIATR